MAVVEPVFQRFTAVGWGGIKFAFPSSVGTESVECQFNDDDAADLLPVSRFQKEWPFGSQGSGRWDFSNTPDVVPLKYAGAMMSFGSPGLVGGLASGPWYDVDGNIILQGDRPVRGHAFTITVSTRLYKSYVAIIPTLNKYSRQATVLDTDPISPIDWQVQVRIADGTFKSYTYPYVDMSAMTPAEKTTQRTTVASSLASDIDADGCASASSAVDVITMTEATPGFGFDVNDLFLQYITLDSDPTTVSYGGLGVNFIGDIFETFSV